MDLKKRRAAAEASALPPLRRRGSVGPAETEPLNGKKLPSPRPPAVPRQPGGSSGRPETGGRRAPADGRDVRDGVDGGDADDGDPQAKQKGLDKQDPLKGKKLNVLSYIAFLAVFVAASFNGRAPEMYFHNSVVEMYMSLGVAEYTGFATRPAFAEVAGVTDYWRYLIDSLAPGLFDPDLRVHDVAANQTVAAGGHTMHPRVLYLVTAPRIHQVRVRRSSCYGELRYLTNAVCYPPYSSDQEEKAPFRGLAAANDTGSWWQYEDENQVRGFDLSITGQFGSYPAGGYVATLNATNVGEAQAQLQQLWDAQWIDAQTRAVIVQFSVYNPSRRLMTVVKVLAEFTATGKVIPTHHLKTFFYKPVVEVSEGWWWVDASLVFMVTLYATFELIDFIRWGRAEAKRQAERVKAAALAVSEKTKQRLGSSRALGSGPQETPITPKTHEHGESYFDDRWNLLDLANYAMFSISIGFEVWSRVLMVRAVDIVNGLDLAGTSFYAPQNFVSFWQPGYLSGLAYTLLGVNAVVTWLKTLKYLNEFPHLSMLSITMSNAYYPTVSFLIMFFIIFAGCGQAFNMAFGPYMKSYNNFTTSMMSLFRALLGEFEYEEMQQTDRLVGPLLFITFMLLVLFVLVNMFIAILSEAYEKAKIEVFGDSFASRDERWKDAVTFIEYIGGSASHVCTGVSKVCKKAVGMSGTQGAGDNNKDAESDKIQDDHEDAETFSPMDMLKEIKENIEDLGKSVRILGQKLEETRKAAAAAKARASLSTGAEEDPDSQTLAQIRALQETMDHIVTHLATQDPAGLASPRPESASPKAVAASPTSDTTPSKADED